MRPLSLNDTVFYNLLGDAFATAIVLLESPGDPAALVAEFEGVIGLLPSLAEKPVNLGFWTFARDVRPLDLTKHISVLHDSSVRDIQDLIPRLERLRRAPVNGIDGPPWRMVLVNPARADGAEDDDPPVSALIMQFRHGFADATRIIQFLSMAGRFAPTDRHREIAARLPTMEPLDLPQKVGVHDIGISLFEVPRRGMVKDGDASLRLVSVAAELVRDEAMFPKARPLKGNIGMTKVVRRRDSGNGIGNHVRTVTVTIGTEKKRRRHIDAVDRQQGRPLGQWIGALMPRFAARVLMRMWYGTFDAMTTLMPIPRNVVLAGRRAANSFVIPPFSGPVPLAIEAFAHADTYSISIFPGKGFQGDVNVLIERIRSLLNPNWEAALDAAAADLKQPAEDSEPRRHRRLRRLIGPTPVPGGVLSRVSTS